MKIIYSPNGVPYADSKAEQYVLDSYEINKDSIITTSTENIITAARVCIKEGKLPHEEVEFYLEDRYFIYADKHGSLSEWPDGFCDYNDKWLGRLIDWGASARI